MGWSSGWYWIAELPHTPSQVTLTNDPVKEAGQGYFFHLTDAGMVTMRDEVISKNPGVHTQPLSRFNLLGTADEHCESPSLSSQPLSLGLSTLPAP